MQERSGNGVMQRLKGHAASECEFYGTVALLKRGSQRIYPKRCGEGTLCCCWKNRLD